MHNSVLSGHLGKKKTKEKLSQRFFWFEMREDINLWIQQCEICGAIEPPAKSSRAPLGCMPTGAPWDRLSTDILGPLPVTPTGNRYILTVTDYFTKWIEVFPMRVKYFKNYVKLKKTRASPNNPKGNGQIERFNRTLLAMITS